MKSLLLTTTREFDDKLVFSLESEIQNDPDFDTLYRGIFTESLQTIGQAKYPTKAMYSFEQKLPLPETEITISEFSRSGSFQHRNLFLSKLCLKGGL